MSEPPASFGCCGSDHCVTCADEAVPMSVLRLDCQQGLALCVDTDDARHTVEIALVEPVGPGQRLLVHAGVALATLPADGAQGATEAGGQGGGSHPGGARMHRGGEGEGLA